jgi:predicted CopG family antitoxin
MHKYSRNTLKKEVKIMAKITTISFADDEYERLAKLAKIEGKSFSKFVKDKLKESIQQEMRETLLLERLIRMIENLQNFQTQTACRFNDELLREIYKLLCYTVMHDRAVFDLLFVLPEKRKEYLQRRKELEEKFGLEL